MTDTAFILSLSDSPQRHAGARFTPNPKSQKHSQPSMPYGRHGRRAQMGIEHTPHLGRYRRQELKRGKH